MQGLPSFTIYDYLIMFMLKKDFVIEMMIVMTSPYFEYQKSRARTHQVLNSHDWFRSPDNDTIFFPAITVHHTKSMNRNLNNLKDLPSTFDMT